MARKNMDLEKGSFFDEEGKQAEIKTNTAGEKTAFVSLQQYRRALILGICGKNGRRSLEICTYSVDEYNRDLERCKRTPDDDDKILLHFDQHKTAKSRKAAIAILKGIEKEALFQYVKNIRRFIAPSALQTVFFSNMLKPLTYSTLNNDLTKIFRVANPDTNFTITTRTFRKVLTTYTQKEIPEHAEKVASLLCHDPGTAKKYYDLSKGMIAATQGYETIYNT